MKKQNSSAMKYRSLFLFLSLFSVLSIPLRHYLQNQEGTEKGGLSISKYFQSPPPCVSMFSSIEKYSSEYNIPLRYALGIAYAETRYEGPFDWDYNHERISSAGALGPMQIMPGTAKWMWSNKEIPREKILSDIDFNVETSMKLLRHLYDRYRNWKIVFGCYNTGTPCINSYSEKVYNFNPKNI